MDIIDPNEDAAFCVGGVKIPQEEASLHPIFPTFAPLSQSLRHIEPSGEGFCAWNPCAEDKMYNFLAYGARANFIQVCKEFSVPRWAVRMRWLVDFALTLCVTSLQGV
jgi:hypothetical protein